MATLVVVYPSAGTKFDRAYYRDSHGPLVHSAWDGLGLQSLHYSFGELGLDGGAAPFHCVATLTFASRAELDAALADSATGPVFADIANFTDATPTAMIGAED
ncbi:EthD family reductase [Glacieibacterium sp.]|uniref:EthD family reductase n=1 Tax=Glacieibacterium sp. TaxID=2860237 RepID=UPI003B00D5E0